MPSDREDSWGYTQHARDRFGETYQGRPVLGRDQRLQGSVDYGTFPGPAIVVNPAGPAAEVYEMLYDRIVALAEERAAERGTGFRRQVLDAVFDVVDRTMTYDKERTDALTAQYPEGQKVDLASYIVAGTGVCRQMALVAGTMLEMLKDRGLIRGTVSIDRNMKWNPRREEFDGHQWVRYTNSAGEVFILDVAQGYRDALEMSGSAKWSYQRPEEREASYRDSKVQPPEAGRDHFVVGG